jgi:CheY-like chemotaxis protein/HPt (histidine-containing phosphotransfer) domain-containing protein
LLNDIIDLSKVEAGKLALEVIGFDLNGLFAELTGPLAPIATAKGIELSCALSPHVPPLLLGDPGRLRQVLTNLLSNALKFTEQGKVELCTGVESETRHEVVLRFSVRDTGIGIPKDKLGTLFQRFSQVDASTTRKYGGTGLGLDISKHLAHLMGGEIGVNSEEGRGSEFWFTARFQKQGPGATASQTLPAAPSIARHERWANARILLAEDNKTNQLVAMGILKRLGLRADIVTTGKETVEALRSTDYDVVLMDVQMPEMDGLEATRKIRAEGSGVRNPHVPIVAMTANAIKGDREACLEAGMDDYIAKPVTLAMLTVLLERWLTTPNDAQSSQCPTAHTRPPTISSADTSLGTFDEDRLIEHAMGDRELAEALVRSFLADIPDRICSLRSNLETRNTKDIEYQARTIKSAATTVGAQGVVDWAQAIESASHANDLNSASAGLSELSTEFARLKRAMEASPLLGQH